MTDAEPAAATPIGAALAPLRLRYAKWMGLDPDSVLADRQEPADEIRAMQLIVRIERAEPPSWTLALSAAATGAALVCLDGRSEPGGEWFDAVTAYCNGHIRKVTRRARAGQWAATADLPGLTVERVGVQTGASAERLRPGPLDGAGPLERPQPEPGPNGPTVRAEVRVLVPALVTDLDSRISRLQVGGTDVPTDSATVPDVDQKSALHLWLPPEPQMTLGKTMAQTGHAGMIAAALMAGDDQPAIIRWRENGCPTVVHGRSDDWQALSAAVTDAADAWRSEGLLAVRDAGFTEIAPGTITVIAQAPRS